MKCREKASFFFYATTYIIGKNQTNQIWSPRGEPVLKYTFRNSFAEMLTRLFLRVSAKECCAWLVLLMPFKDRHCRVL